MANQNNQKENTMENKPTAFVTTDGAYGVGDVIIFHEDALTEEQWRKADMVSDNYRYEYIQAILDKDWGTVHDLEEDYA